MPLTALVLLLACAGSGAPRGAGEAKVDPIVHFGDRDIDLRPILEGFPYGSWLWISETDTLVYEERRQANTLRQVPVGEHPPALSAGSALSDVDFSTRNRWGLRYHAASDALLFTGDERNDEVLNLWSLSMDGGELERLTNEPYLYGWGLSPDEEEVVFIARRGEGPYTSCLVRMAIDGSSTDELVCDTPQASFTWTDVVWHPDERGVLVNVNIEGRRDRKNLAWVPLDAPELILVTDPSVDRTSASAIGPWIDDDRFLLVSDESGFGQVGLYALSTGTTAWLTTEERDLAGMELMEVSEDKRVLLLARHRPDEDTLVSIDPLTGEELDRAPVDGQVSFAGTDEKTRVLAVQTSASAPLETSWIDILPTGKLDVTPWFGVPPAVAETLVHCEVERVQFPTHDVDPATGEPRELHAFLYRPRNPPEGDALARITAFYGGSNRFSTDMQIFCAAGITTLSPAVRGARGFGAEFYRLNDGDLGGDEIADLFAAATFLESLGFTSRHIGVYGGSHGGYATMRALTFPPGTNGHEEPYPFGFGISHAGFSDILTFHADCNIPDWVVLEAGDPATEADKLRDRSPLTHVDKLRSPLLMTHGENDSRVPVRESRQMKARCDELGAPCTYVEFPGQGHSLKGLANQVNAYQARFDFLEQIVAATP